MNTQSFGGDWTEEKLSRLEAYLLEYRRIFSTNQAARFYSTWYVDAFAGTGRRTDQKGPSQEQNLFQDVYDDLDSIQYRDGSARIALGLENPFDRYLFIELSKQKLTELKSSIERDFPALSGRCDFRPGDANRILDSWCRERNWRTERAVVFLDPYGMQVHWQTVELLARTLAVDLWYLFPLGIGVSRLLARDGKIDPAWQSRLTAIFGTDEWRERFLETGVTESLFGPEEYRRRNADADTIEKFLCDRLEGAFEGVAKRPCASKLKGQSFILTMLCRSQPGGRQDGDPNCATHP